MVTKNLNTKLIMPLNNSEFSSLKFLLGINYLVDTITLEITPSLSRLNDFLGEHINDLNGYKWIEFVNTK